MTKLDKPDSRDGVAGAAVPLVRNFPEVGHRGNDHPDNSKALEVGPGGKGSVLFPPTWAQKLNLRSSCRTQWLMRKITRWSTLDVDVTFLQLQQCWFDTGFSPDLWSRFSAEPSKSNLRPILPCNEAVVRSYRISLAVGEASAIGTAAIEEDGEWASELLRDVDGNPIGRMDWQRQPISGLVEVHVERQWGEEALFKISVTVANDRSPVADQAIEGAVGQALVSVKIMGTVAGAEFVPVAVPAADYSPMLRAAGMRELVAPRVSVVAEGDRAELRRTIPCVLPRVKRRDRLGARRCVSAFDAVTSFWGEAADELPVSPTWRVGTADQAEGPAVASIVAPGMVLQAGSCVVVETSGCQDVQDTYVHGQRATVRGIHYDAEGNAVVAVTIDSAEIDNDDMIGRYFYFRPSELRPLQRLRD